MIWIICSIISIIWIYLEHYSKHKKFHFGLIDVLGLILCLMFGPFVLGILIYIKIK